MARGRAHIRTLGAYRTLFVGLTYPVITLIVRIIKQIYRTVNEHVDKSMVHGTIFGLTADTRETVTGTVHLRFNYGFTADCRETVI